MIDSTLFKIFLHNLQCRNRCLRNVVIQTHYTIIPKSTPLQDLLDVFSKDSGAAPCGDRLPPRTEINPILITQVLFQKCLVTWFEIVISKVIFLQILL